MSEPAIVIETCVECTSDLEHCHGTAIVHVDGSSDCSDDPDCRVAGELHFFAIECSETGCDCGDPAPCGQ